MILQQEEPEDYVIATGVTTSVRDFVRMAFAEIGVNLNSKERMMKNMRSIAAAPIPTTSWTKEKSRGVDPKYFRPTEVDLLIGDATKAREKLGWKPKYDLPALVKEMVHADLELFRKEKVLKESGFYIKNQYE